VPYIGSYVWKLRQAIGHDLVVTPAAVVLVLDSNNAVLLIKRTDTGDWALPGGSAEPGGTFVSTAIEELLEETGLKADPADLVGFASLSDERWTNFTFPNNDVIHSFNLCFATRRWTGDPSSDGDESSDVGFFELDALPEPMLPMSLKVLELWKAYEASGAFQAS
jgi:8-oxo-dGTP pyrophosphatase MutT (NUDIX family)